MNRALTVIFATVVLDAMGVGLIMPILPGLLREISHNSSLSWQYGALLALYAAMQFLFSPILGALSDRYGRRPVLMVSLAGAAVDYVAMALSPTLAVLFLTRAIAGITGANSAVAGAYVTDVTPEDQRASRFGALSACFGIGFIAGPALGGLLGAYWLRAPFLAAAALNALNLLMTTVMLPEPGVRDHEARRAGGLNPLASLRWAYGFGGLTPLLVTFVVFNLAGEVGGTIWVLYGQDKFGWDSLTMGLSLAGFGLFHAGAQAFVTGPVTARLGPRSTLLFGVACDSLAYVLIALAGRGWMVFALLPLFSLGGIGNPVLQSLLANKIEQNRQGELQGVLASLSSLTAICAPLAFTLLYMQSRASFPGLAWIAGAALYLICLPILLRPAPADKSA